VPDLQQYSDEQLKELAASDVGDRKKAIAEEILRRRRQERRQKWLARNAVLAGLFGAVMAGFVAFKRWLRRRP
jgi:hypothetical protein